MFNPNHINITPEILTLIAQIDEFKGSWRAMGDMVPERLLALRHVATIESVASSTRIEGSKLSNAEVGTLLANIKVKQLVTRDEQEVAGYAEVMELLFASWEHIPFNQNHVLQLHRDLLQYSEKDQHHRGQYKKVSNNVAAFNAKGEQVAVVIETASPFDTPHKMQALFEWLHHTRQHQTLHPLLIVAIFIVVFLEIHPFEDGNGRLSRILTTLLMLQFGYSYVPYSSLESIIEQNKSAYYIALRQTQSTIRTAQPNWQPWLVFFLSSLATQVKRLANKVSHSQIHAPTLTHGTAHAIHKHLPKLSADLITLAQKHGRLTTAMAQQLTGANRATIKVHLAKLVKDGLLHQHGVGRGTWYVVGTI